MKNFIDLKNLPASDLRKILNDAKKRKKLRNKLNTLDIDKGSPLKGKLLISKSPLVGFSKDLSYLIRYPYGCVEQTTSAVFPQLYLE